MREWDSAVLDEIGVDYHKLLPELYTQLDAPRRNSAAFDWVKERSEEGNVPCLYLRLRNFAHQLDSTYTVFGRKKMERMLFLLALCVTRIAVDIIDAHLHFAHPEVFSRAYGIFCQKFKDNLFKEILPYFEGYSVQEVLARVREWFEENKERDFHPPVWTGHAAWKTVALKSTWGIEITPIDEGLLRSYAGFQRDATSSMHPRNLRPLILAYLFKMYENCETWTSFLSSISVVATANLEQLQRLITVESKGIEEIVEAFTALQVSEGVDGSPSAVATAVATVSGHETHDSGSVHERDGEQ